MATMLLPRYSSIWVTLALSLTVDLSLPLAKDQTWVEGWGDVSLELEASQLLPPHTLTVLSLEPETQTALRASLARAVTVSAWAA